MDSLGQKVDNMAAQLSLCLDPRQILEAMDEKFNAKLAELQTEIARVTHIFPEPEQPSDVTPSPESPDYRLSSPQYSPASPTFLNMSPYQD